uniref:Uncharacterized protein n=1 Tax=Magallana gigas TaxID=29159 RepID=A0A8W8NDH9_MAGGI
MMDLGEKPSTPTREKSTSMLSSCGSGQGEMTEACLVWESILEENPLDMLALKFAHDSYFYQAHHPQMRDSHR